MCTRRKQRCRQRSECLGVPDALRKQARDHFAGGLTIRQRSRDGAVCGDRDWVRRVDDELAWQEVADLFDHGLHRPQPEGEDDRVGPLNRVPVVRGRSRRLSSLGGQLLYLVRTGSRKDNGLADLTTYRSLGRNNFVMGCKPPCSDQG